MFGSRKREERKALKRAARSAQMAEGEPPQPSGNGGPTVGKDTALAPRSTYDAKVAGEMRRGLQKALKRPVILADERSSARVIRTAKEHRRIFIGLGVLGVGIASAVTAGAASAILVITAACLPAADFPTFFGTGALDPNLAVTLETAAVVQLLEMNDAGKRADAVRAAIDAKRGTGPDGRVTLSGEDIAAVTSAAQPVPGVRIEPVRSGVRMGFTVIGAGLLLLALTLIPQDVHGLVTRAASAILVVGVLIVGDAVVNGSWLKGALTGPVTTGDRAPEP